MFILFLNYGSEVNIYITNIDNADNVDDDDVIYIFFNCFGKTQFKIHNYPYLSIY